jgi:L-ascorbate metabolism protein UlaG (beta-lactamase superfamily)
MSDIAITWLGHSAFVVTLPGNRRLAFDPWISNPRCPPAFTKPQGLGRLDAILLSHGHDDHAGDVPAVARATGAPVVCMVELAEFLRERGVLTVTPLNIGGTHAFGDLRVTMTAAVHSSSTLDRGRPLYLGEPAGFIVRAPGVPTIYFAGDTALFGDMKLIREVYAPDIAFLPIGDHFTMGPDTAAIAARWLGVRQVVPMHWGTFPVLTGTPSALEEALAGSGIQVLALEPGETAS